MAGSSGRCPAGRGMESRSTCRGRSPVGGVEPFSLMLAADEGEVVIEEALGLHGGRDPVRSLLRAGAELGEPRQRLLVDRDGDMTLGIVAQLRVEQDGGGERVVKCELLAAPEP